MTVLRGYRLFKLKHKLQRDGDLRINEFSSVSHKRKRIHERRSPMPPMKKTPHAQRLIKYTVFQNMLKEQRRPR